MHQAIPTQGQDLVLYCVDPHEFPVSSCLQPAEAPLNRRTSIGCISHSSQVCITTPAESAVCLIVQVINERDKSVLSWNDPLEYTSSG